jgi:2-polyprenyl-3-methyl-5-hydroxy-6-metoxy-1,4-benzoquinol methylase
LSAAIDPWLSTLIACPYDATNLRVARDQLICTEDHSFAIVDGVPILLRDDAPRTHPAIEKTLSEVRENRVNELRLPVNGSEIDPVVQVVVSATCGRLYAPVIGKLKRYPIPQSRLAPGDGRTLLDIGCNWGRWSFSAARRGYRAVGLDPDLGPLLAAKRIAGQLGLKAQFVAGSAAALPFKQSVFDSVFSYSVIQHLSKDDAALAFGEIGRVLNPGGTSSVQMPNSHSVLGVLRRIRNPHPSQFDVRSWTPAELLDTCNRLIGPSSLSVDGFFGLGVQVDDLDLMPLRYKIIIRSSEALRQLALRLPVLTGKADSVYVTSEKQRAAPS